MVVATVGSELWDGEKVKKTSVGGVSSTGVLCDGLMLGWSGGGAGTAVLLPDAFNPGDPCRRSRPRLDGAAAASPAAAPVAKSTGPGVDYRAFEKKLSKEEKKRRSPPSAPRRRPPRRLAGTSEATKTSRDGTRLGVENAERHRPNRSKEKNFH